jgi:hypothetical protein
VLNMRRREFITLLGGAAAAWPLAASAQQTAVPVVGFLRNTTAAGSVQLVTAFRQGLNEAGFIEARTNAPSWELRSELLLLAVRDPRKPYSPAAYSSRQGGSCSAR